MEPLGELVAMGRRDLSHVNVESTIESRHSMIIGHLLELEFETVGLRLDLWVTFAIFHLRCLLGLLLVCSLLLLTLSHLI